MGAPIARRLLGAGHRVAVWNRSRERMEPLLALGASPLAEPVDLWGSADVCVTMLADDNALRQVAAGAGGFLMSPPPGGTWIEMSTVSASVSLELADLAEAAGIACLRAPVSGNPSVVESGNLGIMASGLRDVFDRVEPLLRVIGPNVFYVGEGDRARILKLALNTMVAGTAELMAEALVLSEVHGLARETVLEVMAASSMGSPFVRYKTPGLVARDYRSTFPTSGMIKDLDLALAAAEAVDVPLPIAARVRALLAACAADGMGELDFIALLPRLQREAGIPPDL
jgi:3-hydroxyisobutyrate dehydrogenase-like beta-hydroxyacid dehydrogenase